MASERTILARWRSLRFRTRALVASLALAAAIGGLIFAISVDRWPVRATLKVPRGTLSLAFSPDGRTFVTSGDGGLIAWDTDSGREKAVWVAAPEGLLARPGLFSPDGRTFAAIFGQGDADNSVVQLIDAESGRKGPELSCRGAPITRLEFSPDGRTLRGYFLSDGPGSQVVSWDVPSGKELPGRPIPGPGSASNLMVSPDGRTLACQDRASKRVRLWDVEQDRAVEGMPEMTEAVPHRPIVGFSGDGRILAIGRIDGDFDLWDIPGRKLLKTLPGYPPKIELHDLRFSPDGRILASMGRESVLPGGFVRFYLDLKNYLFGTPKTIPPEVVLADVETGRRVARAPSSLFPLFSPDGRFFATRRPDFSIQIREVPGASRR